MSHAFRIESERLVARCWSPDDAPAFRALLDRNDRHLRPFIPWMRDEPQPLEKTRGRLARYRRMFRAGEDFRYALLMPDGRLIGELMLSSRTGGNSREVGYLVDQAETGRGYAVEAAAAAVRVAFEVEGVERVELHCCPENLASVRIAEKLDFALQATHRAHSEDSEGMVRDLMIWVLDGHAYAGSFCSAVAARAYAKDGEWLL